MPTLNARRTTVTLFQGDDYDRELELRKDVERAAVNADNPRRIGDSPSVQAAAAAYDEFVAEAAERGVKVLLVALPKGRYRELVATHPPREDSDEDAAWGFDYSTLGDELVPASMCDEKGKPHDPEFANRAAVVEFVDSLPDGDFSLLYSKAVGLNQSQGPDPKASLSSRLARTGEETSQAPTRLG